MLPVTEIFYSIQGEGRWSGTPMTFIRLSGCNLKCDFCDTNYEERISLHVEDIIEKVMQYPTSRVLITGGEPLLHDLNPLITGLRERGKRIHIETNGSLPMHDYVGPNWLTVSPKTFAFNQDTLHRASEIKILCGIPDWKAIAMFSKAQASVGSYLYLMPLDTRHRPPHEDFTQEALAYCLRDPRWTLCLQLHKVLGVR